MTQFDSSLRRALMDANLAQYERALQSAEAVEFSPRYLRERMRLLADPWGWERRRAGGRKRLNWRIAAIAAALLLLSACAAAVATGQFSQWFTWFGVNPENPEQSEEVLSRTGTVIQQSQTVGDTTLTLNAAVWDGTYIYLSCKSLRNAVPALSSSFGSSCVGSGDSSGSPSWGSSESSGFVLSPGWSVELAAFPDSGGLSSAAVPPEPQADSRDRHIDSANKSAMVFLFIVSSSHLFVF